MVIVMDYVSLKLVFMTDKTEWHQMASEGGGKQYVQLCGLSAEKILD